MAQMNDFQLFIKVNKLKQKQVAEYLGTSTQYVNQVANGKCALSGDKYELLAQSQWDVSILEFPAYLKVSAATMTPYPIEGAVPQGGRYIVRNHKKATSARIGNIATVGTAAPIAIIGDSGALLDPSAPAGVTGTLPKAQPSATPTEAMRDGVNVITDAEVLDLSNYPVEVIEELRTEIKKDEAVPIISAEVAACDKYDISEYLEEDNELEHFIPSDMTADVDGAEIVRKTSMLPTFAPNDVVFIKLIKDKTRITDGGTYYFKLRKRATMIRMAKIKGNELRLIAQNPQFGDVITTFDEVINVASIEGLYRKNIANQYNEIEALRRRKDAQTDELIKCNGDLIKQNGDALKIVDRLVSVIEKKQ